MITHIQDHASEKLSQEMRYMPIAKRTHGLEICKTVLGDRTMKASGDLQEKARPMVAALIQGRLVCEVHPDCIMIEEANIPRLFGSLYGDQCSFQETSLVRVKELCRALEEIDLSQREKLSQKDDMALLVKKATIAALAVAAAGTTAGVSVQKLDVILASMVPTLRTKAGF